MSIAALVTTRTVILTPAKGLRDVYFAPSLGSDSLYEIHKSVNEAGANAQVRLMPRWPPAKQFLMRLPSRVNPSIFSLKMVAKAAVKQRIQAAIDALVEVETQLELATEDLDLDLGAGYEAGS